jgi:hypothetical protein
MGGKRTVLILSAAVSAMLVCAGAASAAPPPPGGVAVPVTCSDQSPGTIGDGKGPGGGQMIHPCGPR